MSRLHYAMIPEQGNEPEEGPLAILHDWLTSADIARVVAKLEGDGDPCAELVQGRVREVGACKSNVYSLHGA